MADKAGKNSIPGIAESPLGHTKQQLTDAIASELNRQTVKDTEDQFFYQLFTDILDYLKREKVLEAYERSFRRSIQRFRTLRFQFAADQAQRKLEDPEVTDTFQQIAARLRVLFAALETTIKRLISIRQQIESNLQKIQDKAFEIEALEQEQLEDVQATRELALETIAQIADLSELDTDDRAALARALEALQVEWAITDSKARYVEHELSELEALQARDDQEIHARTEALDRLLTTRAIPRHANYAALQEEVTRQLIDQAEATLARKKAREAQIEQLRLEQSRLRSENSCLLDQAKPLAASIRNTPEVVEAIKGELEWFNATVESVEEYSPAPAKVPSLVAAR